MPINESRKAIITLQKKFITDREIGKFLGITKQAVHQMRKKCGVPALKNKYFHRNYMIREDRKSGVPISCLVFKYHLSKPHLIRICRGIVKFKKGE